MKWVGYQLCGRFGATPGWLGLSRAEKRRAREGSDVAGYTLVYSLLELCGLIEVEEVPQKISVD